MLLIILFYFFFSDNPISSVLVKSLNNQWPDNYKMAFQQVWKICYS